MKDFCEKLGISRGGLYRHFSSTKEIFIAMLDTHRNDASDRLMRAIASGIPARKLLRFFMDEQKQEIKLDRGRLSLAIYEFCNSERDQKDYMIQRHASAVETLLALISYGQSRKEFGVCNAEQTAEHIVLFLEGLRLSSTVLSYSDERLDKQLGALYERVVKEF